MPKLIDYPRTSYTGAWEVAEVVDDTGGKCALETCARKLNRKVSGSFKAIVGSAVKFGLLTSKRELLTTTTLFRRIKHAYDKQEELLFHREAFLTPPLFTQICRKFRGRELPVAMLDVLLIREFDVEEINAQGVAKAFIDGARMINLLDEHNIVADIDQLATKQPPKSELASPKPGANTFRQAIADEAATTPREETSANQNRQPALESPTTPTLPTATTGGRHNAGLPLPAAKVAPLGAGDAIASLFGFSPEQPPQAVTTPVAAPSPGRPAATGAAELPENRQLLSPTRANTPTTTTPLFKLELSGPGINTVLEVLDADDLLIVRALLDKIERQLRRAGG